MAQKVTVALQDDLDGGPADETLRFAIDGTGYEIDLRTSHADAFRKQLAPYIEHARKAGRSLPHKAPGGALSAVSCTSPSACTATGSNFSTTRPTLAERWNGRNWRVQPTPNPPNFTTSREEVTLNGVSCTSARACTATGKYAPGGNAAYFLEAWNGRRWRLVTAPHPAGFAQGALNGISCAPARCTAVGAWSGGPVPIATLAMAN